MQLVMPKTYVLHQTHNPDDATNSSIDTILNYEVIDGLETTGKRPGICRVRLMSTP